ncbi:MULTISPECIES: ABC-three component system protein [Paenibacillus]|uniref:HNH endonuclease n=1 Tax=Paenibacillus lactis TaxID=228574 RepID=A0ABS4F540_9BACL|nr:ABC-three component system protein [Paenibacillus lactis]MBP1891368.1 hypothetical protein [Paenibacillus lactis]MCM3493806.1 HNH endonuclease [Paenibacillus lactis]HAF98260.1 HNH endonuclease [Paenibacillus lactis]
MQDNRKPLTENENLILFSEVEGICPLCAKSLIYSKGGRQYKIFEGAHIYPLNPSTHEISLLKDEEKLSEDVNDINNYIALCRDCHRKFDNPRTVAEYRKLLSIKKQFIARNENRKQYSNYQIEYEIKAILTTLASDIDWILEPETLNLDAIKVDEKANGTLSRLTKRKIKSDVAEYYLFIKEQFTELDKTNGDTFETIATQVKAFYMVLKKAGHTQEDIYQNLSEWLSKKTENSSLEACKIVISFFVQNCEVFS